MAQQARREQDAAASPPRIFVSYSHHDNIFASRLEADLRAAGAQVLRVSSADGGDFQQRINEALAACEYVVLVLTKDALASPWVVQEMHAAIRLKNQGRIQSVLPVQAGEVSQRNIPPLWGVYNIFDATRDYAEALAGVLRAVGLSPVAETAAHPTTTPQPLAQVDAMKEVINALAVVQLRDEPLRIDEGLSVAARMQSSVGDAPATSAPPIPQPAESAEDLVTRGKTLSAQRQYAEAIPFFERATRLVPDSYDAWFNLGNAHNELEHWQEALAACDQALSIKANDAIDWVHKGILLCHLKRYEEALVAFDQALAVSPRNRGAFGRILGDNPADAPVWYNKGIVFMYLKRYEEALAAFNRAIVMEPTANAWRWKAANLRGLGREAEAQEADRRARELGGSLLGWLPYPRGEW